MIAGLASALPATLASAPRQSPDPHTAASFP
jgi:hypothetical protein